jgi:pimeloyl-ACP methyl ester carboxylesterase
MDLKTVTTPHVPVRYYEGGSGTPLVFLHGAGGIFPNDPFLDALAKRFHVFAPLLPGYGDSGECHELRDMLDITLHTWDVIEALGLKDPVLAGHSMGGMIAAEMAAIAPHDVSRLALIASGGLWLGAHPIPDIFTLLPYEYPAMMFHDPEKGAEFFTAGTSFSDPEWLKEFLVRNARQLGMAGKILFPIPDRGLSGRLYRIGAKTLIIWGESDRLVPPVYARAFAEAIANSERIDIAEAGHLLTLEQPEAVAAAVAKLA